MPHITRRQFIQRSAVVATATSLASACSDTTSNAGERPRAIVIGSGFGGSVAALLERVIGDNVDAICGACVGGGSLVYGGVLIQPQRDVFSQVVPQIGAGRIPEDILESDNYRAHRTFLNDARAARTILRLQSYFGRCLGLE